MRYAVELDPRHLQRLSGPLLSGVIELVWNAIDADAQDVQMRLKDNGLGGVSEVEVVDDGHGIDLATAKEGFLALGRSWKADVSRSKTLGRPLHGKEGRGRFKLFRHGGCARWESVSELEGQRRKIAILVRHGDRDIEIDDLGETSEPLGTRVLISGFGESPKGLTGNGAYDRLVMTFVLALEAHRLRISYDGRNLDASEMQRGREELEVAGTPFGPLEMTVIEWTRAIGHQDLHLCTGAGAVLEKVPSGVPAPGAHFTAYLRWDGFAEHAANLAVSDLDSGEAGQVIGAGRDRLERHFEDLVAQRKRLVVSDWRKEGVYPFAGAPAGAGERAVRQTFDVVALEAAETINRGTKASKRLSLRLLREALERNPGKVHRVVAQALALSPERLEDLDRLLDRTQLSHIITASTSIADRLDFLQALSDITCDPDVKDKLLERPLHSVLEDETWVFGEEYALAISEAGLTQVLEQHIELLGREKTAVEPVRDGAGKVRRVDLMLAAAVPQARDVRDHLVIELKRPSVPVGPKELQQVKEYALAVAEDSRFDTTRTRWEFWVISTDVVGTADRERRSHGEHGLAFVDDEARVRIWVKRWSEVIHDAEHRLKYVKERLGVAPDQRSAMDYLGRMHGEKVQDGSLKAAA